jgi:uncharacterized protein with PIN domain
MLQRLARWLRAAGYDAALADPGAADGDLLAEALASGRWLVTRDRGLLHHRRAAEAVILLAGESTEAEALSLSGQMPIDWMHAPMTRCLVCNVPLSPAAAGEAFGAPEGVRARKLPVTACPVCQRIYWPGGHEARLRRTLAGLQQAGGQADP